MGDDPLDDIMGYLGLEPPMRAGSGGGDPKLPPVGPDVRTPAERLLARAGGATIWRTGNSTAEWIEVRGRFPTFRATGPKARLIVQVSADLETWASGGDPHRADRGIVVSTARRRGIHVLEVSYRTWKPVRLTRDQAAAVVRLIGHVDRFARDASPPR